jgi:hypothetical protein
MVVEEIHERRPNDHPAPDDLSNITYIGLIKALSSVLKLLVFMRYSVPTNHDAL